MPEKDYSHRGLADKLGLKPGMRVRVSGDVGEDLRAAATEKVGGSVYVNKDLDVVIRGIGSLAEAEDAFERLRPTLADHAAVWLVTRKKGHPKYLKQEDLIPLGKSFGLVDNKICSVDDGHSAMRFVIPRELRGPS